MSIRMIDGPFHLFIFAVEGSGEPELCPVGTFSPASGLNNEAGCQPCTAGFYCRDAGLRAPTGPCSQGQPKTVSRYLCLMINGVTCLMNRLTLLYSFTLDHNSFCLYRLLVSSWSDCGYSPALSCQPLLPRR